MSRRYMSPDRVNPANPKTLYLLRIVLFAAIVSGCFSPGPVQAQGDADPELVSATPASAVTTPVAGPTGATGEARRVPSLADCLRAAIDTNPGLMSYRDGVAAARQREARAQSARLPRVKAEETFTRLRHVSMLEVPGAGSFPLGKDQLQLRAVHMSQPVYTGGAIENGARAAQAEVALHSRLEDRQREDLARSVAEAWFALSSARAMAQVASQALYDTLEHERNVANLLEAGVTVRDDLLKVQVSVLERRENLVKACNGINLACSRLNQLTGLAIEADDRLPTGAVPALALGDTSVASATANASNAAAIPSLDEATAKTLAKRAHPLIAAAREKKRIGEFAARAARGALQPNVALQWNWTSGNSTTPDIDNWDATVYVGLNVFDAGEARTKVREAQAETRRATHECEELQRNIDLAIRQAHLQISEANARFELANQAQTQAMESKRLTEARYEAGAVTSQSLIDAESALVAARQRLITAGFDRELAKVALWHAAGRLTDTLLPGASADESPLPTTDQQPPMNPEKHR